MHRGAAARTGLSAGFRLPTGTRRARRGTSRSGPRAWRSIDRHHRGHDYRQRAGSDRGNGVQRLSAWSSRVLGPRFTGLHSRPRLPPARHRRRSIAGAGEGNRTLVISLEGCCSTIELHPRRSCSEQLQVFRERPDAACAAGPKSAKSASISRHRCRTDGRAYPSGAPAVKPARGPARSRHVSSLAPSRNDRPPPP